MRPAELLAIVPRSSAPVLDLAALMRPVLPGIPHQRRDSPLSQPAACAKCRHLPSALLTRWQMAPCQLAAQPLEYRRPWVQVAAPAFQPPDGRNRYPADRRNGLLCQPPRLPHRPRHDRLCGVSRKRAETRSCIERLKDRDSEPMPLVTRTPRAWEIAPRDFTHRVKYGVACTSAFDFPIRYNRAAAIRPERSRPHGANYPHAGMCR
jgi:hypothetical protein